MDYEQYEEQDARKYHSKKKKCPKMPSGKHRYIHIKGENCGWTLYKIGSQYRYTWSRHVYTRKDNWISYDCQCTKKCRECGFSPKYGKRVSCATVWDQMEQPSADDKWRFKTINGVPQ